ncbi:hypothetical protein ACVBEH_29520, partial [Roseateles sp. GG27B]
ALTVGGTTGISAAGQVVTLDNAANDFSGLVTANSAAISLRDSNALSAALTASGNSPLQAAGDLVVSGSTVNLTTSTTSAGTTRFGA